ncbi:LysR substrate-binding domain-containing protein [Roseomonas gilardii]|uniref:LysR substrate-binding domain-containing protein n=1 Tax=Roseomonas gilardii TaxID=257708 RepID=UPI0011A7091B|nr:LysR substrate-binding domain-containing protein [Roseomonas gilardii]
MFELSQLRCFVAVAEELHFGRAAARLHMTQPPLSRQIQLLEHALDVRLLERSSRSVRLTQAGRAFFPEARRLLQFSEGAALAVRRVARGEAGSVTIGFTAGTSFGFLPRFVSLVRRSLPRIDMALKEMVTRDQMEALAAQRIDLGFVRPPFDRRGVEAFPVWREPLVLAVPEMHPFAEEHAGQGPFRIADLNGQDMVMYSPTEGQYFHGLVSDMVRSAGALPNYVQYISQIHTILPLVGTGLGLAIVPASARSLGLPGIRYRDLPGAPSADLFAVVRNGDGLPALRMILELLRGPAMRPEAA